MEDQSLTKHVAFHVSLDTLKLQKNNSQQALSNQPVLTEVTEAYD